MSVPDTTEMVKVELSNADGDKETLWSTPKGNNLYYLENSPFFAYDVSWQDIIEARPDEREVLVFARVIEKSGNRTVRIILKPPNEEIIKTLEKLGCSYEGANPTYLSINIPIEADFPAVCAYLTQREVQWEHADPSYEKMYPSD